MLKIILFSLLVLLVSCSENVEDKKVEIESETEVKIEEKTDYTSVKYNLKSYEIELRKDSIILSSHYRGLQIKNSVAYIAGSNNMMCKYFFDSETFYHQGRTIPYMEFRDIHRINSQTIALSIINPAALIGFFSCGTIADTIGYNFNYRNNDTLCFLDGMDFWNDSVGIVFGDPLDGYPFVLKTININGGGTWNRIEKENLPQSLEMEAGFAASGTSIVCVGDGIGYIGLGGEQARIFKTMDYGDHWEAINTCMLQGESGKGIYSMAFKDELNGVAVGGNWENTSCVDSKIYTNDGGLNWHKASGIQEYRSCVTHWKDGIYISTGTSGTDISYDNGVSWTMIDALGFNSIAFMENGVGIGVGNRGLIRKLKLSPIKE